MFMGLELRRKIWAKKRRTMTGFWEQYVSQGLKTMCVMEA